MDARVPFDLDLLRTFVAVARARSFRRAAEDLEVSQPAVSQQIARLEGRLGQALFERTTRRVGLTGAGSILFVYARNLLDLAEEARAHLDRLPNAGVLRLGVVEDFGSGQLHRVLRSFHQRFPHVALTVSCDTSEALNRGMEDGEFDVILVEAAPGDGRGRRLWREPMVWVGEAGTIGPDDEPIPLVTYPAPSPTRDIVLRALRDARQTWSIVAESSGASGLIASIGGGLGVAALGERFVPPGIEPIASHPRLPALGDLEFTIVARRAPRNEHIDGFVSLLEAVARPVHTE